MKLNINLLFPSILLSQVVHSTKTPYERLNRDDALLLIVDLQVGLFHIVRDLEPGYFRNAMIAHSAIGLQFDLPVIMTTSAENGPNGHIPREILDMHPNATIVRRNGEVNAWDSPELRAAVQSVNKTQIIIAGILTDVCTAFLAQSLRDEGYSVWANAEASGTTTPMVRDLANDVMRTAGVHVTSMFAIVGELMRDWRGPYSGTLYTYFDTFFPTLGMLARYHRTAIENGTIQPGEGDLPI